MRPYNLLDSNKIAVDSNIFIYLLEDNPNFPQAKQLFSLLSQGGCQIYTSTVTLIELTVFPFRHGKEELAGNYIEFLEGNEQIKIVPVNKRIAIEAARLRAEFGLKTPDAIQLATAVLNKAEYFLTADRDYNIEKINNTEIVILRNENFSKA